MIRSLARNVRITHRAGFSSVASQEVEKFSTMSQIWWDPLQNPLIGMNPIRVEYILRQLGVHAQFPSPLKGLRALDVGCGGGLLSESLARLGANVTAIDPSEELVEKAKEHALLDPKTAAIDFQGGTSIENMHEDEAFDVICILEVLEHVEDVQLILNSASKLLKKDGTLFVSTLNKTTKSHLLAIIGGEYFMRYLPIGTHDWNKFLSPFNIQAAMHRANLQQIDSTGMIMRIPPLDGKWRWELAANDQDVNWIGTYKRNPEP